MLSIARMAKDQVGYYVALAHEEYYLDGGEPPGTWWGRGAAALGLTGTVERTPLRNLFTGHSPTGEALVQNAGKSNRRPGFDLTFSAPKSVSTFWSQANAEVRRLIQDAHYAAVTAALAYLEDEAAFARHGKGGAERTPAHLVVAIFEHGTSRALDPQLHSHALVTNIACTKEGRFSALDGRTLYHQKMTAGAAYRAELSAQLEARLGLTCVRTESWFEIHGVPDSLIKAFSSRRSAIEKVLTAEGLETASAAAFAALSTRPPKELVPPRQVLFETWQKTGVEHGFSIEQTRRELNTSPTRDHPTELASASSEAIAALLARSNSFTRSDYMRAMFEAAQGKGIGASQIRDYITASMSDRTRVVPLAQSASSGAAAPTRLTGDGSVGADPARAIEPSSDTGVPAHGNRPTSNFRHRQPKGAPNQEASRSNGLNDRARATRDDRNGSTRRRREQEQRRKSDSQQRGRRGRAASGAQEAGANHDRRRDGNTGTAQSRAKSSRSDRESAHRSQGANHEARYTTPRALLQARLQSLAQALRACWTRHGVSERSLRKAIEHYSHPRSALGEEVRHHVKQIVRAAQKDRTKRIDRPRIRGHAPKALSHNQSKFLTDITKRDGRHLRVVRKPLKGEDLHFALAIAGELWAAAGYRVVALARNREDANTLARGTGLRATTHFAFHYWMNPSLAHTLKQHAKQLLREALGLPTFTVAPFHIHPETVVVVDSADKLHSSVLLELLEATKRDGGMLVLLSEPELLRRRAHPGKGREDTGTSSDGPRGGPRDGNRRRAQPHDTAGATTRTTHISAEPSPTHHSGKATEEHAKPNTVPQRFGTLSDWARTEVRSPRGSAIFCNSSEEADRLNRLAQSIRISNGIVAETPAVSLGQALFRQGDRIWATARSPLLGIVKGDLGTVAHIDAKRRRIHIDLDRGPQIVVPLDDFDALQLGYAFDRRVVDRAHFDRVYLSEVGTEPTQSGMRRGSTAEALSATSGESRDLTTDLRHAVFDSSANDSHDPIGPTRAVEHSRRELGR